MQKEERVRGRAGGRLPGGKLHCVHVGTTDSDFVFEAEKLLEIVKIETASNPHLVATEVNVRAFNRRVFEMRKRKAEQRKKIFKPSEEMELIFGKVVGILPDPGDGELRIVIDEMNESAEEAGGLGVPVDSEIGSKSKNSCQTVLSKESSSKTSSFVDLAQAPSELWPGVTFFFLDGGSLQDHEAHVRSVLSKANLSLPTAGIAETISESELSELARSKISTTYGLDDGWGFDGAFYVDAFGKRSRQHPDIDHIREKETKRKEKEMEDTNAENALVLAMGKKETLRVV